MREEYDFSGAIRGKYADHFGSGRSVGAGFRIQTLVEDEWPDATPFSGRTVLRFLQRPDAWRELSIVAQGGDFPRLHLSFHPGDGFVVQCFADSTSLSDFLVSRAPPSAPSIEIDLGGQARERWPAELFVAEELAEGAINYFLERGAQDPDLHWVGISSFAREVVWEGREQHQAWRREQGLPPLPERDPGSVEEMLSRINSRVSGTGGASE